MRCEHPYGWAVYALGDSRIDQICFDGDDERDAMQRMHAVVRAHYSTALADRLLGVRIDRHFPEDHEWQNRTFDTRTGVELCWKWSHATANEDGR